MARRQNSIFVTMFLSFFLLLVVMLILFSVFYYNNESEQVKSIMFSFLESGAEEISESIDSNINEMDAISASITSSYLINTQIRNILSGSTLANLNSNSNNDSVSALRELLFSSTGIHKGADQINLFFPENTIISVGINNDILKYPDHRISWDDGLADYKNSSKMYLAQDNSLISQYYLSDIGKEFFTIIRSDHSYSKERFVNIQVKKSLLKIIADALYYQPVYEENLFLFDSMGNQLLSTKEETSNPYYFEYIKSGDFKKNAQIFKDPVTNDEEYIFHSYSPYSGIHTIFSIDKQSLLSSVYSNFLEFLPFILLMLVVIFVIAFFIAKYISHPINQIYNYVKTSDFTAANELPHDSIKTNLLEINTLIKSFNLLQTKLNESNQQKLELQKQEMQSKMLSLQSQMNPHFLYNSLSTIQAMADEGMNDTIILMCQTTSRILRYISSDKESMVTLKQEIDHTRDFLECMYIRYDGDLTYDIHIPEEMNDIKIPKLCVQLLVENSVKFTTQTKSPWRISVYGTLDNHTDKNIWLLSVKDSGPGFTHEGLSRIQQEIEDINQTGLLPSLELQGMGLLNVYIRLRLTYGDDLLFFINNRSPRGSEVIIGGKYD